MLVFCDKMYMKQRSNLGVKGSSCHSSQVDFVCILYSSLFVKSTAENKET